MDSEFYADFFGIVNAELADFVQSRAADVIAAILPVAISLMGVYIILWGVSMAYGKIQEPVRDGLFRLLRLSIILGLALNLGLYNAWIADFVLGVPDELSAIISGDGTYSESGSVSSIDQSFNSGWVTGQKYWDAGKVTNVGPYFLALAVWGITIGLTGYAAFMLLLAKIAISVLLATGPLFLLALLFEKTQRVFDAWMSQVMNFIFLQLIAVGIMTLILDLFAAGAAPSTGAEMGAHHASYCVVSGLLGLLVMAQAPGLASGISAGATLATLGAVHSGMSTLKGGAGSVASTAFRRSPIGRALAVRSTARQLRTYDKAQTYNAQRGGAAAAANKSPSGGATSGAESLRRMRAASRT